MQEARKIAEQEYAEAIDLENRLSNSSSEETEIFEEDRLIVGHLIDFMVDNFEAYVKFIKQEKEN